MPARRSPVSNGYRVSIPPLKPSPRDCYTSIGRRGCSCCAAGRWSNSVPPDWELWLDGGHNPLAGEILGAVAAGWHDRPLYLVVGMMNTKDAAGFIAPLGKHARALWAVTIPGEKNALPADAIAVAAASVGLPAQTGASVLAAIRDIPVHDGNGRILICGSLYFAGKVLAENG